MKAKHPSVKKPQNCLDCVHAVQAMDPDPFDWFCDDDMKVTCSIAKKTITIGCRPYNLRRESKAPNWCPLK